MDPTSNRRAAFAILLGLAFFSRIGSAQGVYVGATGDFIRDLNPVRISTALEDSGANVDGPVDTATFAWSSSPCPAAVKIKFFRPVSADGVRIRFDFVAERGPFDVLATSPLKEHTVPLNPPVALFAGDVIALTNLTACGGPVQIVRGPFRLSPFVPPAIVVAGDIGTSIPAGSSEVDGIYVLASGSTDVMPLLGRFQVSVHAVDPRSLRSTEGHPEILTYGSGYFSLPDFTGDAAIPEVTVKMVDATSIVGGFWFFHASLTDVQYTITVRDQVTGAIKTFMNTSASPGQLCGGVDTTAFPGP